MSDLDGFDALLGPPATPAQRRLKQASQARFDHALELVEQAAKAASTDDQAALAALVVRMDQAAFDDFEQFHPPSAALDFLLYQVVCELVPDDADARFGDTWGRSCRLPRRPGPAGWGCPLGAAGGRPGG